MQELNIQKNFQGSFPDLFLAGRVDNLEIIKHLDLLPHVVEVSRREAPRGVSFKASTLRGQGKIAQRMLPCTSGSTKMHLPGPSLGASRSTHCVSGCTSRLQSLARMVLHHVLRRNTLRNLRSVNQPMPAWRDVGGGSGREAEKRAAASRACMSPMRASGSPSRSINDMLAWSLARRVVARRSVLWLLAMPMKNCSRTKATTERTIKLLALPKASFLV